MSTRTSSQLFLATTVLAALALPTIAQEPEPVSPGAVGSVAHVATSCPTFSWGSRVEAERHEILVYRIPEPTTVEPEAVGATFSPEAELVSRIEVAGSASSWTPPTSLCLAPGGTYAWTVRSITGESTSDWAEARLFAVDKTAVEMSDLERTIEDVVARYLGQTNGNESLPAASPESPARRGEFVIEDGVGESPPFSRFILLEPDEVGLSSELSGAIGTLIGVYSTTNGQDGSAGVWGETRKNPFDPSDPSSMDLNSTTYGVVGVTHGKLSNSAGVFGKSASETSTAPKYGVLGESSDSNAGSAGVAGIGSTGVLGIGETTAGIGLIGVSETSILGDLSGIQGQVGTFGLGKTVGVQGRGDQFNPLSKGVIGEGAKYGIEGRGLTASAKGAFFTGTGADLELGTGIVTLGPGATRLRILQNDGTTLAPIDGTFDATTLAGEPASSYLRSNVDQTFTGNSLTIQNNLNLATSSVTLPTAPGSLTSGGGPGTGLNADLLDGGERTFFLEYANVTSSVDMKNIHVIRNIGDAGTDFTAGGGLTLAGDLAVALGAQFNSGGTTPTPVTISGGAITLPGGEDISNFVDGEMHFRDGTGFNRLRVDFAEDPGDFGIVLRADKDTAVTNRSAVPLTLQAEDSPGPSPGPGAELRLRGGDAWQSLIGNADGGSIILDPGRGVNAGSPGSVDVTSSLLYLDSDNTSSGGKAELIVPDPDANDPRGAVLLYDRTADRWKIDNGDGVPTEIATLTGATGVLQNPVTVPLIMQQGETLTNATDHIMRIQDDILPSDTAPGTKNFKALDIEFPNDGFALTGEVVVRAADTTAPPLPAHDGYDLRLAGGEPYIPASETQAGGDLILAPGAGGNGGDDGVIRVEGKLKMATPGTFTGAGVIEFANTSLREGQLDLGNGGNDDLTASDVSGLTGGADAGTLHTHDGRYFTETELQATGGTSGATRIGIDGTNFQTPLTVQSALNQLAAGTAITQSLQSAYEDGNTIAVDSTEGTLSITDTETGTFTTMSVIKTADVGNATPTLVDLQITGDHNPPANITGLKLTVADSSAANSTRTGIDITMASVDDDAITTNAEIVAAEFVGSLTGTASDASNVTCTACVEDAALVSNFEEEGQIRATVVSGNATDDTLLLGSAANAASWVSVPDCAGDTNLKYTASTNTFSCTAGAATAWEDLANSGTDGATSYVGSANADTVTFDFQSAFAADRFAIKQTTGNPTAGTLLDLRAADADVVVLRAGDGTNGVTISQSGALTAEGTGSITATAVAANSIDGTDINLSGNVAGDLMYYNGTNWVRLAAGASTAGQVLTGGTAPAFGSTLGSASKTTINDVLALTPRSSPPATPALGDIYVDSDTNELCFYDGTAWTGLKAGGACA